jgi:lipoate-protein ligase A
MKGAERRWRLIEDTGHDAATNMAVDEAVLRASEIPTLRLYEWSPPAVSIGYFQSLEKEVDERECILRGIDIVRRITGGGAVFHDMELTYSFTCPENLVPADIIRSYELLCGIIVKALEMSGLEAEFSPINDILSKGKKVSGNAQTRKQGRLLQHGTIILDTDPEKMFTVLKVPDEKLRDKLIKNARERVTSLKELGVTDIARLRKNIVAAFEDAFGISLSPGRLTKKETELAEELRTKFHGKEWNHMR